MTKITSELYLSERWQINAQVGAKYSGTRDTKKGAQQTVLLHRFVMCCPQSEGKIVALDGNRLNCQKHNLRFLPKDFSETEEYAKIRKACGHRSYIKGRYNFSYSTMAESQKGLCKICGRPDNRNLSVDHDHSCCPDERRSCGKCIRRASL